MMPWITLGENRFGVTNMVLSEDTRMRRTVDSLSLNGGQWVISESVVVLVKLIPIRAKLIYTSLG